MRPARRVWTLFTAMARGIPIALVYLYQGLSAVTPGACRYQPTCSQYALTAVRRHGALRGGWLALRRILRCHPLAGWGFDPVPPAERRCGCADSPDAPRVGRPNDSVRRVLTPGTRTPRGTA